MRVKSGALGGKANIITFEDSEVATPSQFMFSVTEQLWHQLTKDLELSLVLLRRPSPPDGMACVEDVSSLLDRLECD